MPRTSAAALRTARAERPGFAGVGSGRDAEGEAFGSAAFAGTDFVAAVDAFLGAGTAFAAAAFLEAGAAFTADTSAVAGASDSRSAEDGTCGFAAMSASRQPEAWQPPDNARASYKGVLTVSLLPWHASRSPGTVASHYSSCSSRSVSPPKRSIDAAIGADVLARTQPTRPFDAAAR